MKQIVFNKNGKVVTSNQSGKMFFPHREMGELKITDIGIVDNYEEVAAKENYGFFSGVMLSICKPSYLELAEFLKSCKELNTVGSNNFLLYYTANESCYIITDKNRCNYVITKDADTGEVFCIIETMYTASDSHNKKYYMIYDIIKESRSISNYCMLSDVIVPWICREIDIALIGFQSISSYLVKNYNDSKYTNIGIINDGYGYIYVPKSIFGKRIIDSTFVVNGFKSVAQELSKEYYQEILLKYWDLGFGNVSKALDDLLPEELHNRNLIGYVDKDLEVICYNIEKYDIIMELDPELKLSLDAKIKQSKEDNERMFKGHARLGASNIANINKYNIKNYITLK